MVIPYLGQPWAMANHTMALAHQQHKKRLYEEPASHVVPCLPHRRLAYQVPAVRVTAAPRCTFALACRCT
jgi:hypothetical protein